MLQGEELLTHLLAVSRRMVEMRALGPLLSYAVDEVLQLVGAGRGYIVLLQADGTFDFRIKRRADKSDITGEADPISYSVLKEVIRTQQPILVRNAMLDPRFGGARSVMIMKLRSIMCAPLITQNRIIGAVYVENRSRVGRFSKENLAPLEFFSNQAAVAIENAKLNETLASANEELRRLDESKRKLVQIIAHELRTPITSLNGYMQMLKLDPQPVIVDYLEKSVDRVVNTIQEVVISFRIISDQLEIDPVQSHLEPLVQQVLEKVKGVCTERNLMITTYGLQGLSAIAMDKAMILLVLDNVIGNAMKFTPDGGSITLRGQQRKDRLILTIQDSGIGIPVEEQERVFDLFHVLGDNKTHSTSKYAFGGGGLGLGLSSARGIVRAHEGTIYLESPGYDPENLPGTICTITLPTGM